jgi:hypothetical protein
MGNKIITEKDFWMCTMGAVPAQLQGTRLGTKKESGEIYITVEDKATSSWIDFGCKKYMLLMALAVAAAVVLLAVVGVLTVATGGLALIALGAVAGLVGAAVGAVVGACLCGQKVASKRKWSDSKSNFISQGTKTITGDHFMTCAAGGTVKFAPNIKSWGDAIALGALNYVTGLVEGALGGAMVGLGGGVLSGAYSLALPTLSSIGANVAGGFTGVFGATRVLFGANALANDNAVGNVNGGGDALGSFTEGAIPEIGSIKRIATGQAHPSDALLLLYLLHLKTPAPKENVAPKEEPTAKPKEEEVVKPTEAEPQANAKGNNGKKGEAYESPVYRQDNKPYSNEGRQPGRLKSGIDENGDLLPANKDGTATIQDHVRGTEPKKSDSPYTSFSEGKPGIGKKYGDNVIELDVKKLEGDIANGKVKDVEVIRPKEVQSELQKKIDSAEQKYNNNPTENNLKRLEAAKQDLEHAQRDAEVLVKGKIPAEYIKVYPQ